MVCIPHSLEPLWQYRDEYDRRDAKWASLRPPRDSGDRQRKKRCALRRALEREKKAAELNRVQDEEDEEEWGDTWEGEWYCDEVE